MTYDPAVITITRFDALNTSGVLSQFVSISKSFGRGHRQTFERSDARLTRLFAWMDTRLMVNSVHGATRTTWTLAAHLPRIGRW
jgi:hypothetical protein